MAKETYLVTVDRPRGVSQPRMQSYILTAIKGWSGGCDPKDLLFNAFYQHNSVQVQLRRKAKDA